MQRSRGSLRSALIPLIGLAAGSYSGAGGLPQSFALEERGRTLFTEETFDGNGRVCSTCHEPEQFGTITPEFVQAKFAEDPDGPLFRAIDSDDGLGVSYERLKEHATIRIPIETPYDEVLGRAIRRCDAPEQTTVFVNRGNPSVFNVALEEKLMHDMREGAFTTGNAPVADVAGAFSTTDYTRVTDPRFGEVPLNVLRICQWTWQCSAGDLHPNREGYAVIARAFASVLFKEPGQPQDIPRAEVNDNRSPAGRLENGVLEIDLVATPARWYPEADDGPSLAVEAFAEEGGPPRVPGPMIRGPAGTTVHATVRNAIGDTLLVVGLSERDGGEPDTLRLLPGETRDVRFTLREPGTFLYRAFSVRGDRRRNGGRGGQLAGAIVVDPATASSPNDRIFLLSVWNGNPDSITGHFVMAINGKAWPHTERLTLATGDSARWRVVNATASIHPMHLHGFHFRVDSRGDGWIDTILPEQERPMVVTEVVQPGAIMSLTWVPRRAGRWLFHCHIPHHVSGDRHHDLRGPPYPDRRAYVGRPMTPEEAMAGLVIGIEVTGEPAAGLNAGPPAQRERLIVTERAGVYGTEPGYGFVLQRGVEPAPDSVRVPGSPIVLTRGEPTGITVVNRSSLATSVHWHGLELESYYDGVPGWSGDVARIAPHVMPGDSFTVRMAPPRAGTFIYHTHAKDFIQLSSGLYGPLIVLEPGEMLDPAADHTLLFSLSGPGDDATVALNGGRDPALAPLEASRPHRLRFINITVEDEIEVALFQGAEPLAGRLVSKDAGEVPPGEATARPVRFRFSPGETYDFEIVPAAGELRIEVRSYNDFDVVIPVRGK